MMNGSINVLAVDDRRENILALSSILERLDVTVVEALSGQEALALMLDQDFALVLLDVQMPGMDGFETARLMRGSERTKHVPIIFVTAISKEHKYVFEGYESGAVDYLFKPLDPDIVRSKVNVFTDLYKQKLLLSEKSEQLEHANRALKDAYRQIKHDLAAAGAIQHQLLPSHLPEHPEASFAWKYDPCEELAGDILNVLEFDDNRIGLYLLDVSGHGVQAALLSSALSNLLTSMPKAGSILCECGLATECVSVISPSEVAARLNDRFPMNVETGQYFTIHYGVLDLSEREYGYVSAGHPAPVVVPANGDVVVAAAEGPAIGWFTGDMRYAEQQLKLNSGDRVVIYSDGVVEAVGGKEEFGNSGLLRVLTETRSLDLDASLQSVMDAVRLLTGGVHQDDVSLVGFEIS
jgi:sigma-B regulation protein RsbU (phosphoserine phosphatase)